MKHIIPILLISIMSSCSGHTNNNAVEVPYGQNPKTPTQAHLDSLNLVPFDALVIETKSTSGGKFVRIHRKDSILFTGWTIQIFENNQHRFRYVYYENGFANWQIGYYDSGQLGHDFHMKDGVNCGSSRMWHKSGCLYISTYFLEGGLNDGPTYAWHKNCILSRDALFDHDTLIYEVKFDLDGKIVEKSGKIPAKYK